jgi:hypothetical protein
MLLRTVVFLPQVVRRVVRGLGEGFILTAVAASHTQ